MHRLYFICERKFYARKHYATLENNPKGALKVDFHCRVIFTCTHVNFTRVNEIETMYGR